MELKNFRYIAYNADKKIVRGTIEALNRNVCLKFLQTKNYDVIRLTEYRSILSKLDQISFGTMLKPKQLVFFLKQLGSLLKAGVKLLPALELLSLQQENRLLRKLYFELYQQVYNGYSFSRALSQRPKEFPNLLCQMIEVGEISGDLPDTILRMSIYYENQMKIITKIKSAVRMPMVYLFLALIISAGMLIFVFPNIAELYASFEGAKLPAVTQFFLNAGEFTKTFSLPIFLSIFMIILTVYLLDRFVPKVHYGLTVLVLKTPIFGPLLQMNNQILIANSLSQMMGRGINSIHALNTVRNVIKNVIYKELMTKTLLYIEDGKPFSKSFEESPFIDAIMGKMIATGEKSGDIPKLMENLSTYYNGVADLRVEQIRGAIQPILLIFVYGLVGLMILALMMPMLSLGSQI